MRSHWTTDLDIASLESRRSWATLAELQTVIPFHLQRYKTILELECRKKSFVTSTDLTFATRFVAVFMYAVFMEWWIKQFLKRRKDTDSILFTSTKSAWKFSKNHLGNSHVQYVRPLLKPQCEYLLLNRSGSQFQNPSLSYLAFSCLKR
jgi:hypothetical protein